MLSSEHMSPNREATSASLLGSFVLPLPAPPAVGSTTSAPEAEAPESLPVASNCCGGGTHSVLGYEK